MIRRPLILSATAFLLGALLVHFYLRRLEAEISGGARIEVLVAATDLSPGHVLTEADVMTRRVPEAYVDGRRIRGAERRDVLGVPVTIAVDRGDALLWSDVAGTNGKGRQLSELITEGKRALTVTSKLNLFEGLLRPGDRVDVLLTISDETGPATYTLLQHVLVLSVGGDLGGVDAEPSRDGGSVNLSVDMDDAHTLVRAEQKGRLRLVLRNPNDVAVLPSPSPPRAPPRPPPPPRPVRKEIEHVR